MASMCLRMQYSTSGFPPAIRVNSGAFTRAYTYSGDTIHIAIQTTL